MVLAARGERHHEQFAGLEHALDLQLHERVLALAERARGGDPLFLHQRMDAFAQRARAHPDEAPRLHEAHARGLVRRPQQTLQQRGVDRIGQEMAHVAPLGDRAVHRLAVGGREGVRRARGFGLRVGHGRRERN